MENNQKALAEKIREFRASIHAKQQALNRVEEEISSINRQIRVVQAAEEMSRQQRINFLDLNLEAHKLTDKRDKYQFEIEIQQKALADNLETMEEMEKKSFFKRLLHR
jgi:hypothetical protein